MKARLRESAVAGLFYPEQAGALREMVDGFLERAVSGPAPKAVIVPHAGYIYSGPVAATAYARLCGAQVSRVVLMGPSHRSAFHGVAASSAGVWRTPLGDVPLDVQGLDALPQVRFFDAAHGAEHSLEVQLPFLQRVFDNFCVVPLLVGDASAGEVAEVLDALWGGPETLVVVSSDLSHYESYEAARALDAGAAQAILALDERGLDDESACGCRPVRGLLRLAKQKGLRPELLDLRNSGDTAGSRDQVVGYGAFAFYES
jgi:AmmeMemoRadiSam system protein B